MAIRWDFKKDKVGTMKIEWNNKKGEKIKTTLNLYSGNALLIILEEHEKTYQMIGFFADKEHMKNCLGLSKGHNNIYDYMYTKITLNLSRDYKETPNIAQAFAKAKFHNDITINIKGDD